MKPVLSWASGAISVESAAINEREYESYPIAMMSQWDNEYSFHRGRYRGVIFQVKSSPAVWYIEPIPDSFFARYCPSGHKMPCSENCSLSWILCRDLQNLAGIRCFQRE